MGGGEDGVMGQGILEGRAYSIETPFQGTVFQAVQYKGALESES